MGNNPSGGSGGVAAPNHHHQPLERAHVSRYGDVNTRRSLRSPRKMDRLRRSFRDSFRRRKERMPESSKPHQWQADEAAVRSATCTFAVKYLGCVEVFESRGMQVCEEALKVLRASRRRPIRAILHVSGDGLRVVEDDTKGLIVDQTIEKVSFCAPDRNHERGFSYICRDGTTRRWMCHGFLAMRESGERLSHAVGCAFAACLERKQRRDKECGVTMTFDASNSTFTRQGSFRQRSLTEQREDSVVTPATAASLLLSGGNVNPVSSAVPASPAPPSAIVNPFAIERPHAAPHMLERQGSFRGLSQLGNNSPFKRQMSLRVNELPSNAERLRAFRIPAALKPPVSPIPEISPGDSVTALCQQLSQGLSRLTHSGSDDFNFNSHSSVDQNNVSPRAVPSLASAGTTLPDPDQWLGRITAASAAEDASPPVPVDMPAPAVRRAPPPMLGPHSRTMSLGSAESFGRLPTSHPADPFDAEWAALAARQENGHHSTNPFLAGAPSVGPQPFQVQL